MGLEIQPATQKKQHKQVPAKKETMKTRKRNRVFWCKTSHENRICNRLMRTRRPSIVMLVPWAGRTNARTDSRKGNSLELSRVSSSGLLLHAHLLGRTQVVAAGHSHAAPVLHKNSSHEKS